MSKYEYESKTIYWDKIPTYAIIETIKDQNTGTIWHKLDTNEKATRLILASKAYNSFDIYKESSGKAHIWATAQLLTLLHLQGLKPIHS